MAAQLIRPLSIAVLLLAFVVSAVVDLSGIGSFTLTVATPVTLHWGLDLGGGTRLVLQMRPLQGNPLDNHTVDLTKEIVANRVHDAITVSDAAIVVTRQGGRIFLRVDLGDTDTTIPPRVRRLLLRTARFSLVAIRTADTSPSSRRASAAPTPYFVRFVDSCRHLFAAFTPSQSAAQPDVVHTALADFYPTQDECVPRMPLAPPATTAGDTVKALADNKDILDGSVAVGVAVRDNSPAIDLVLTDAAATRLQQYVAAHPTAAIAIVLDNAIVSLRPVAGFLLGNLFQITRVGATREVIDRAIMLRYGPLPVGLQMVQVRALSGPIRTINARASGVIAAAIGVLVIVILFGIFRHRGLIIGLALAATLLATVATIKLCSIPLTEAGLAGLVLASLVAVATAIQLSRPVQASVFPDTTTEPHGTERTAPRTSSIVWATATAVVAISGALYWIGLQGNIGPLYDFALIALIGIAASQTSGFLVRRAIPR